MTQVTYRDCLGTLNVNLKVLSARLDNVLEQSNIEKEMETHTAAIYALERLAMDMSEQIQTAIMRVHRIA